LFLLQRKFTQRKSEGSFWLHIEEKDKISLSVCLQAQDKRERERERETNPTDGSGVDS